MPSLDVELVLRAFRKAINSSEFKAVIAAGRFVEDVFSEEGLVYFCDESAGVDMLIEEVHGHLVKAIFWHVLRDGEFVADIELPFGLAPTDTPEIVTRKLGQPTRHIEEPHGLRFTLGDLTTAVDFHMGQISLVVRCVSVNAERFPYLQ